MASISVKLRVVGIQFHTTVTIDKANPTIVDLLEAARANSSGFNFVIAPDGTLHQASAIKPAGNSISSGRSFPAGLYVLSDGVAGDNSVTTWQWYLIRNGLQINLPNAHVEPFSTHSPTLENGDEVIWRLVVVATRPRIASAQSSFYNKTSRLARQ